MKCLNKVESLYFFGSPSNTPPKPPLLLPPLDLAKHFRACTPGSLGSLWSFLNFNTGRTFGFYDDEIFFSILGRGTTPKSIHDSLLPLHSGIIPGCAPQGTINYARDCTFIGHLQGLSRCTISPASSLLLSLEFL